MSDIVLMGRLFLRRLALGFHIIKPPEGVSPELCAEIEEMARRLSQFVADQNHGKARDYYPEMLKGVLETVGRR